MWFSFPLSKLRQSVVGGWRHYLWPAMLLFTLWHEGFPIVIIWQPDFGGKLQDIRAPAIMTPVYDAQSMHS